jgi:hypothetical protein
MEKNRLVVDVIKVVVKIIPKSETNLINELNQYKTCMFNQAPEVLSSAYCWIPFLNILNTHIPDIKEDWQIKIREILENNEIK